MKLFIIINIAIGFISYSWSWDAHKSHVSFEDITHHSKEVKSKSTLLVGASYGLTKMEIGANAKYKKLKVSKLWELL